ncbi:hypothetical protein PG993_000961 [Apiospora rasikravindrae]|uniref:Uncharacterized protein n=1 Tax=Apiospora rasikravindrae TaxID=990691 RepID=A0ABR1UA21_9PEZI
MNAAQSSKRKRELVDVDTNDDDANAESYERASAKRACGVIKEEPDDDRSVLLSLPEHPQESSPVKEEESVKKEEEEDPETGRNGFLTPPPSRPESSPPPSPPPKYYHPAFPDRAVRCRYCQRTDKVLRVPAARSNTFNGGRLQFTCAECGEADRWGGFISWADTTGVYDDNIRCFCGLSSRADLTTQRKPSGRIFFTCAVGQCGFWSGTDVKLADKADLELAVGRMKDYMAAHHLSKTPTTTPAMPKEIAVIEPPPRSRY